MKLCLSLGNGRNKYRHLPTLKNVNSLRARVMQWIKSLTVFTHFKALGTWREKRYEYRAVGMGR
jgi:hypothetical protein